MAEGTSTFAELARLRVGIFGVGVEGRAALAALRAEGGDAVLVDDRGALAGDGVRSTEDGGLDELLGCAVVLKAPGVPPTHPAIVALQRASVEVTSALSCWLASVDPTRVVLVTGTKGKSTTSAILGHLLNGLGHPTLVAGNIGVPPYDPEAPHDVAFTVLETSSFQAHGLTRSVPLVAVTALGQDHLDWHGDVATYVADKLSIATKPGADLVVAADDPALRAVEPLLGAHVRFVAPTSLDAALAKRLGLAGSHHVRNVAVARSLVLALLGAVSDEALLEAAAGFTGLPSRCAELEPVGGVRAIDDSLATNPLPTVAALEAFAGDRLVLLVGGHDRGVDYAPLGVALAARREATLVLGLPDNGARILDEVETSPWVETRRTGGLDEAVEVGFTWLDGSGVLLLSPAAPSFGRFVSYADRAAAFAAAVDRHR